MSLRDTFCSSPWLHMRINNNGTFEYCRWAVKRNRHQGISIREDSPIQWFQKGMSTVRQSLLSGSSPDGCSECHDMDRHDKISGRQRQLLKTGITIQDFEKTLRSTPWFSTFQHSELHQGDTDQLPVDWQIDLGNFCNSACVFCDAFSSSRLAQELKKLDLITAVPPRAWCDDPELLAKFITVLEQTPNLTYLHFIGGETLITPAFREVLSRLHDVGLNERVTVGFTTNLTVWDQSVVDLLRGFRSVNLGMSIECLHPLNDYVRYPSTVDSVMAQMAKWLEVAREQDWLSQLRITPTVLSIWHLDTVFEHAVQQGISVESCNFLSEPAFMRPAVLPFQYRLQVIDRIESWIQSQNVRSTDTVINTRDPDRILEQVVQDAQSYVNYLRAQADESDRLPDLVRYLQRLESNRGNCVLDYLPEYAPILRSAGY